MTDRPRLVIGKRTWAAFREHEDGTVESTLIPTWAAEAIYAKAGKDPDEEGRKIGEALARYQREHQQKPQP